MIDSLKRNIDLEKDLVEESIKNEKIKTMEKLMEAKRKKTEEVLYDAIPSPVVTFDQNTKFVDCNQSFLDKVGFSKDELERMSAPDFVSEKDFKKFRDVIKPALIEGRQLRDIDLQIKKKRMAVFSTPFGITSQFGVVTMNILDLQQ